jgi:penicillin-binding protein 1A
MIEVMSEESANKMLYMLKSVVADCTASRLRRIYNLKGEIGGKTGTTNNNSDAWFMGITPTLVNACWVGGDDRDIHFDTMTMGQGAAMALPIFGLYMQKIYADQQLGYNENAIFDVPEGYDPCSFVGEALESEANEIDEIYE